MLSLTDDNNCQASAYAKNMISIADLKANKALAKKFVSSSKYVSKFYGCFTRDFAETWNKQFGTKAAGAKSKIDFGVINKPSHITNVLERIEKTPTSFGTPGWQEFK